MSSSNRHMNFTRILVIDDDSSIHTAVDKALASQPDLYVLDAEAPGDGIRLALDQLPDMTLLDINMPGMDGFKLYRLLKEATPPATSPSSSSQSTRTFDTSNARSTAPLRTSFASRSTPSSCDREYASHCATSSSWTSLPSRPSPRDAEPTTPLPLWRRRVRRGDGTV
jgi:CheY-like chemotaxis protein